jgi:integrase
MRKSSKSPRPRKPPKDFPLFAHQTGQWAKKVRGKTHYFGVVADPDAALKRWLAEKDDLLAGRVPRQRTIENGVELRELVGRFLDTKAMLRDSGELSAHSWRDYYNTCERLTKQFGKHRLLIDILPEDFEKLRSNLAANWGPVRLGNEINRVRIVFNYAYKNGLIDRPMLYGEGFKRPSKKSLRIARASKGTRAFSADELRRIIDAASPPLSTMFLLGINCGLGNSDCGKLPIGALDLDGGWLNYPRPKTGINRRCRLWPETIKLLRAWLEIRPTARNEENADLVFLTAKGGSWAKETSDNPVSKESRKLLDELGINGNRNFYATRHTFETIGGASLDQVAVDAIMGHDDGSIGNLYREGVKDERLIAVADHVRTWLFKSNP